MDKYLLEILKNVNTIIIPGLGALTITNHDTGEIMFMSYLKHDDGKLVSYIMENEGFEELEAKNLIAKYVREIELTVGKGDSYDMFQFGSFYKNGDDIDFKNWDKSSPSQVEKKEPAAKKEEVKPEVKPIEKALELENILVEKPKKDEPKVEKEVEKVATKITPDKAEAKKALNIKQKEEQLKYAEKLAALKKAKEDKKLQRTKDKGEKSKRGVGFWMLIGIIVLIVAGGTYFGLNYNELKQHIPFLADKEEVVVSAEEFDESDNDTSSEDDTNNESVTESEEDVLPVEDDTELVEEEVLPTEPIAETPVVKEYSGGDLPFHLIAGAFTSEDNARRMGEKFSAEGYSVKVGPGKGMNLVSIKSFSTREEAQSGLNELRGVAPNCWIYEWK